MKKILNVLVIVTLVFSVSPGVLEAKGGGGRSGGFSSGSRSASSFSKSANSSKPSAPKPAAPTPKPTVPKPPAPKPPPSKPSVETPKVTKASPVTVNGKKYSKTGNVVGEGYQPRFRGGYVPPAGSTVYYRDSNDWMMWIPILYLLHNDAHRDAVVETKTPVGDGTESVVTQQIVQDEAVDTMYVINWIITILFGLGLIALAMWLVNKASKNK